MRVGDFHDTQISIASETPGEYLTMSAYAITDAPADDLVVHECAFGETGWRVSCRKSGFAITQPNRTREGALRDLEQLAHTYGEYFAAELDERCEKAIATRRVRESQP